jgi:hypothetical protein
MQKYLGAFVPGENDFRKKIEESLLKPISVAIVYNILLK